MTTGPNGAGTVLAGRYRLDDLLAESHGARFWRATDTILARSVAIHALPSGDPRAPGLLEAARLSTTVVDVHLLRVLDCDDDDGVTWAVNEWGEGISLDLMLQQGTLPPSRAAWLTREVAEAIAAGHAQGVAHGRLNPEAVLVTSSGAVKLIGYAVDASLEDPAVPDPLYGELDEREADVINLAGILYAALTGRWPGVTHSSVPAAPREARRPLSPRQVRAGVPRMLDAICERVLYKEASLHAIPIETAHEIAAALSDYVGDPGLVALDATVGAAVEPTAAWRRSPADNPADEPRAEPTDDPARDSGADADEEPEADPEATQVAVPLPAPGGEPEVDPDATEFFASPAEGTKSLSPLQPPPAGTSFPPPFPEAPERPLFADSDRRVPGAAPTSGATSSGWADPAGNGAGTVAGQSLARTGDTGHRAWRGSERENDPAAYWPFQTGPETGPEADPGTGPGRGAGAADHGGLRTGGGGRGWLRAAVVAGVLLVLVGAVAVAFNRGRQDGSTPSEGSSTEATSSPSARGGPLRIAGVSDFDPESDDPQENPDDAPAAIDGDPATSWTTSTYFNDPELGGLKEGVGLVVDLGSEKQPASVTVRFQGSPTSFEVYAAAAGATTVPQDRDGFVKVGGRDDAPARARIELDPQPKTRYLLVWLTRLPPVSGGFRGEIAEIAVRS